MKKYIFIVLVLLSSNLQAQISGFLSSADKFFKEHVVGDNVNYQAIIDDPSSLDKLVDRIAKQDLVGLTDAEEKAFYVNAYNILVINSIAQKYPVSSPLANSDFFDERIHTFAGNKFSLNQIEKEQLIPKTKDARLHFVLVCAAKSCPAIAPFAYTPDQLDQQLDARTTRSLDDPQFLRVRDGKVELSQIFNWYKSDFKDYSGGTIDFINQYRSEKLPENTRTSFYTYDWSLNDFTGENSSDIIGSSGGGGSNLTEFTPSVLLSKGQFQLNVFTNIFSQRSIRDSEGDVVELDSRGTFLNSMLQFTWGTSQSGNFNLGFDVLLSAASSGDRGGGSTPFQIFNGNTTTFRGAGIAGLGPRIRFVPFPKKFPNYSIQSTFLFPISQDLERRGPDNNQFIAHDRFTWLTQFFYDLKLSNSFRLFLDYQILYQIRRNSDVGIGNIDNGANFVRTPYGAALTWFPSDKVSFFGNVQYNPRWQRTNRRGLEEPGRFGLFQWFVQSGGGLRYQLLESLSFEASFSRFVASRGFQAEGNGKVVNFGINFIRR